MTKFLTGTMAGRVRYEAHATRPPDAGELRCMIEILEIVHEGLREHEQLESAYLMRADQDRMAYEGGPAPRPARES